MKKQFINNKYEEIELIGQGTFGKVYKAKEIDNPNHLVAVKQIEIPNNQNIIESLKQEGLTNKEITLELEKVAEQINKEIKIMELLKKSNNIVKIEDSEFQVIETPKSEIKRKFIINIVMELLTPLEKRLESNKITLKESLKVFKDITKALIICEENKVIHRDVKIENIFYDEFNNYKLGDFGEAKNIDKTLSNMTRRGTENYMAPELYKGEETNKSIDIYSLGMVLYRILNNKKPPFLDHNKNHYTQEERELALKKRITGEKLPNPINAPEELSKIILKCLSYKKEERYQSAKELYEDLEKLEEVEDKKLFTTNIQEENEKELVNKKDINIIRVIELTEKEKKQGCKKKIKVDNKEIIVDIPSTKEKDEIIISPKVLKEYGLNDNRKITLIISNKENDKKEKQKYILIIPLIIMIIILISVFFILKKDSKNNIIISSNTSKKLICTVKDTSTEVGQTFSYSFLFDEANEKLKRVEFIGDYPPFEDLEKEEYETLADEYKNYFCNDKLVKANTCLEEVLDNNHIKLSFEINTKVYLDTYRIRRIKDNTLLEDLKNYYELRDEDACEEVFVVEEKSCSGKFKTTCRIEEQ